MAGFFAFFRHVLVPSLISIAAYQDSREQCVEANAFNTFLLIILAN